MATGDINYLKPENNDCSIEDNQGNNQRGILVATPGGFGGTAIPFETRVSFMMEEGMEIVDKFGSNPDVDIATTPEYIWPLGNDYSWGNDTGEPIYFSSSVDTDTQLTEMSFLVTPDGGTTWNPDVVQQNLAGQTKTLVNTTNDVVRGFRGESLASAGDDYVGDIYVYYDTTVIDGVPQDLSKVLIYIPAGSEKNQSKQLMYTIPSGYWGFLYRGEAGITRGGASNECEFAYLSRRKGQVFKEKKDFGTTNQGNPYYVDRRPFEDIIPPQTDLAIRVNVVGANDTPVWGTFHILLITQERFDKLRGIT